jgi:hypothetical protein
MFHTKFVEEIKTILFVIFFKPRDNVEKYCITGMPQVTMWRMRIACWTPKATDTNSEYVIVTVSALQQ